MAKAPSTRRKAAAPAAAPATTNPAPVPSAVDASASPGVPADDVATLPTPSDPADVPAGIDVDGKTLRIRTASQASRRRIGRAFGPEPIELEADDLNEAAVVALFSDPQLLIEVV